MRDGIGREFHQRTKNRRGALGGRELDWNSRPPTYKEYADAPRSILPPPLRNAATFDDVVHSRRSVRDFTPDPIALEELSYLLWSCTGIREHRGQHAFRTAPSAGALYPIETYVVVNDVQGLVSGLYHYGVRDHSLQLLRAGDLGEEVAHGALEQDMCAFAPVVLIWTAIFARTLWKYGQRGYRYVYLDAGHVGAQLSLAATALGMGSCQIAAMFDDEVNAFLGVDGVEESVVYMSVVGHPSQ
jgi:SagB-type dehydrogenase family enzyme